MKQSEKPVIFRPEATRRAVRQEQNQRAKKLIKSDEKTRALYKTMTKKQRQMMRRQLREAMTTGEI